MKTFFRLFVVLSFFTSLSLIGQIRSKTDQKVIQNIINPSLQLQKFKKDNRVRNVSFIENKGQWDNKVKFLSRSNGMNTWLTEGGITYDFYKMEKKDDDFSSLNGSEGSNKKIFDKDFKDDLKNYSRKGHIVNMQFLNTENSSSSLKEFKGSNQKDGYFNYIIGNDKSKWASYVHSYGEVKIKHLYDGIDARLYSENGMFRYDFIVLPNADPNQIQIKFDGDDGVGIDKNGDLVIKTSLGDVKHGKLFAYQENNSKKDQVECSFKSNKNGIFSFDIKNYDRSQPLIIDPLVFSAFLGGDDDEYAYGVALDGSNNVYVTGRTYSPLPSINYPTTTSAYSETKTGADYNVFVTKLDPSGTTMIYSTYIGGSGYNAAIAIAVNSSGNAFITGTTASATFPVTGGAFQTSYTHINGDEGGSIFVTKLASNGTSLVYSTFVRGTSSATPAIGKSIAIDASDNAYVAAETWSETFPTTGGAFMPSVSWGNSNGVVFKLNSSGSSLLYSTYIVPPSWAGCSAVTVDGSGYIYVAGWGKATGMYTTANAYSSTCYNGTEDVLIFKLDPNGTGNGQALYSTYIGGSGYDHPLGIAVSGGYIYITGVTGSADLPTTTNAYKRTLTGSTDAFVMKVDPVAASGPSSLVYSTYLGGASGDNSGNGIVIDGSNNIIVTGTTTSSAFPTTTGAYQTTSGGGTDAFLFKMSPAGTGFYNLEYSTYTGNTGNDMSYAVALDGSGNAYITGNTNAVVTPVEGTYYRPNSGSLKDDVFLQKFSFPTAATCVTNAVGSYNSVSMTLNGSADALGTGTFNVVFKYGISGTSIRNLKAVAATPTQVSGTGNTSFSTVLNGLIPATSYIYCLGVVRGTGDTLFSSLSGTTTLAAPTATTNSATSITTTTTTLNGTVNAENNGVLYVVFRYGTGTGSTLGAPVASTPGTASGTVSTSVIFPVTGLTPGTSYNFNVGIVRGIADTIWGIESNFATLPTYSVSGKVTAGIFTGLSLNGIHIDLFEVGNGTPITSTSTDVNGNYQFTNLNPGNYYISPDTTAAYSPNILFRFRHDYNSAVIFNNYNGSGVADNPTQPTEFTITNAFYLKYIQNYHFNSGAGKSPTGTIEVKIKNGASLGIFPTDPANTMNWVCYPRIVLQPGTYQIIDSDPASWSHNSTSGYAGFSECLGSAEDEALNIDTVGVTVNSFNVTDIDMRAIAQYNISGTTTTSGFNSIEYALSGGTSMDSKIKFKNSNQNYNFKVDDGGSYTVTPSLLGYSFTPSSYIFNNINADQLSQNFTAAASPHTPIVNYTGIINPTSVSATITGTVRSGLTGAYDTLRILYGTTSGIYDSVFVKVIGNNGGADSTFLYNLTGLNPSQTYYSRIAVNNNISGTRATTPEFVFNTLNTATVTDIDGNIYNTVTIGTQVWTVENLKTTKYRNGDTIPDVTDNTTWSNLITGAYCNYNNDANNATTFGRLFNWYAVNDSRNIAPTGWHVPTDAELTTLLAYLGGESIAGGKLKESLFLHWGTPNTGATNETGFTSLPGGYRISDGTFNHFVDNGMEWSSTELNSVSSICLDFYYAGNNVSKYNDVDKPNGLSVRLIKDDNSLTPTVFSAVTNLTGDSIRIRFSKSMNNPTSNPNQFTISGGHTAILTELDNDNQNIRLLIYPPIVAGENITISFTPGTILAADGGVLAAFSNIAVTNSSTVIAPPTLDTAYTSADGLTVYLKFDKAMTVPDDGNFSYYMMFDIYADASPLSVDTAVLNTDTKIVEFKLAVPILSGQAVTVNYSDIGTNYRAVDGGILASFINRVVNNRIVSPPSAPVVVYPTWQSNQALSVTLQWNTSATATKYIIELMDTSYTSIKIDSVVHPTNTYSPSGLVYDKFYYWRVRAVNSGGSSSWSTGMFGTLLTPPTLNIPSNNSTVTSTDPAYFNWNAVVTLLTARDKYKVWIDTDPSFTSANKFDTIVGGNLYMYKNLLKNKTYYWKVYGYSSSDTARSDWSQTYSFSTTVPSPTLFYPVNNQASILPSDTLKFYGAQVAFAQTQSIPGSTSYRLQITTDTNNWTGGIVKDTVILFQPPVVSLKENTNKINSIVQLITYPLNGIQFATNYYWRVQTVIGTDVSTWTPSWKFTTLVINLTKVDLTYPNKNSSGVSIKDTLKWAPLTGATSYEVQLSLDTNFTSLIMSEKSVTTNFKSFGPLSYSTEYYWRVRGISETAGPWSDKWSFRTNIAPPTTPTLISPLNLSTNLAVFDTLTWTPVQNATGYILQVAYDPDFNNLFTSDGPYSTTSRGVGEFGGNQIIYWRVAAVNAGGQSSWSQAWNFSTRPLPPMQPSLVQPVNLATSVSVRDSLRWNELPVISYYWLQLSTDTGFTNKLIDDRTVTRTSYGYNLISNTNYYWRVQARNGGGESRWSETWKFTTLSLAPEVPVLSYPANNYTDMNTGDAFTWNQVNGISSYRMQVSQDSSFANLVIDDTSLTTNRRTASNLQYDTRYFWRVNSKNPTGTSAWSQIWNFTTKPAPVTVVSILYPVNNATDVKLNDTLKWVRQNSASSYRLQFGTDSSLRNILIDDSLTVPYRSISSLQNNSTYYWRVLARNRAGTGEWTSTMKFTTVPLAPSAPTLIYPVNQTVDIRTSDTLRWSSVATAKYYRLQISADTSFTNKFIDDSLVTTPYRYVSSMQNITRYYWRVSAGNDGGYSSWSEKWQFTTVVPVPQVPSMIYPSNNLMNVSLNDTIKWSAVQYANTYRVQVSTDSAFGRIFTEDSTLTQNKKYISGMINATSYYWRVSAKNNTGTSAWSQAWKFNTKPFPPAIPVQIFPTNMMSNVKLNDTLKWLPVTGADNYQVQLSRDSLFGSTIINDSGRKEPKMNLSLDNNTTYYWRVLAINAGGKSLWSQAWRFSTVPMLPQVALLIYPPNNYMNVKRSDSLVWQNVTGAEVYRLQVSKDSLFTNSASIFIDDSTLKYNKRIVDNYETGTKYFWRVQAINGGGKGPWSPVWKFRTIDPIPGAVSLVYPPNLATGIQLSDTLRWTSISNVNKYYVQLSIDSSFGQLIINDSIENRTYRSTDQLAGNTRYYWRVSGANSGGRGPWSQVWVFLTVPGAPTVPALANPVNGSRDIPISSVLVWNPSTGAERYNVQVSLDTIFNKNIINDTTASIQRPVSLVYGTTYYWRVKAINLSGVSKWSANWRFSTVPAPPTAPILVSPKTGMKDLANLVKLEWVFDSTVRVFTLQVSTDSTFNNLNNIVINDTSLTKSTIVVPLNSGTQYYWRVSGTNISGKSPWSQVWNFKTYDFKLTQPITILPINGSINISTEPMLVWSADSVANMYNLQISTDTTFTNFVLNDASIITNSKKVGPLNSGTNYYWRVSSILNGIKGPFSKTAMFRTATISLATPVLVNPLPNAISQPVEIRLSWTNDPLAQYNNVQLSSDSLFTNIIIEDSLVKVSYKQVGPLKYEMSYYWRVKSRNETGMSLWSLAGKFKTTAAQIAAPILISPQNNADTVQSIVDLVWSGEPNRTYYLQLSLDPLFANNIIINDSNITQNRYTARNLLSNTRYYWRVQSRIGSVVSPWSNRNSFTTQINPPLQVYPINNGVNIPLSVKLQWQSDPTVTKYHIQVFSDTNQAGGLINDPNVDLNEYAIGPLKHATTYYWRIKSQSAGTNSKWSPYWSFSTILPALQPPTLYSPVNNGNNVATSTTFSWSSVYSAINYNIQISDDPAFTTLFLDDSYITSTTRDVTGLYSGATYYWRVKAINSIGSSDWSSVYSFSTVLGVPGSPTLVSPYNQSNNRPLSQDLIWTAVPSASYYRLQVSFDQTFNSMAIDSFNITNSMASVTLPPGNDYYWRVKAFNGMGEGQYSDTWKFRTINLPPNGVSLISPQNNASDMNTNVTLSWSSSGVNNYWLQVSLSSNFENFVVNNYSISTTSYVINNLSYNTTYYWRVKSVSSYGESPWSSEVRNFTTTYGAPSSPQLILPSNFAFAIPINTTLQWNVQGNVEMFALELSSDPTFANTIVYEPSYTSSTRAVNGLNYGTTYYWRVKARNMMGESDWVISQFSTIAAPSESRNWDQPDSTAKLLGKINCIYSKNGYFYAGGDSGVYKRFITTTNWMPMGTNNNQLRYVTSIVVNNEGDVFASTMDGIWRLKNGETSWKQKFVTFGNIRLSLTPSGDIVGSYSQTIIISRDKGENWLVTQNLPITDNCQSIRTIFSSSTGNIYIGTQVDRSICPTGGIVEVYLSNNNGQSWSSLGFNGRDNAMGISAMCVLRTGELIIGTTGSSSNPGSIYSYLNGVWTKLNLFGDIIPAIASTPGGELFVSSLFSNQTGVSFKKFSDNGRDRISSSLDVKGGVSKSKDGGKNWEQVNDGLIDTKVSTIDVTPTGQVIIGTSDGGVFEGSYEVVNKAPFFTSNIKDTTIYKGQTISLNISADDPNKDKIIFTISNLPSGSRVDSVSPQTRVFRWTPQPNQVGVFSNISVGISDGKLNDASSFSITVSDVNGPPQFASALRDTTIKENQLIVFSVKTQDPDNDIVSYKSVNFPSTAKLEYVSAYERVFSWKPTFGDAGVYRGITIQISDGLLTTSQIFNITVKKDNRPPNPFTLNTPTNNTMVNLEYPGKPIQFKWTATSDPDIGDNVNYTFYMKGSTIDTTVYNLGVPNVTMNIMNKLKPSSSYYWYVRASDGIMYSTSDTFYVKTSGVVTGSPKSNIIPKVYSLEQNYPNPFNPSTNIQFGLPKETKVTLEIYNILGQRIRTLLREEYYSAGTWNIIWDGKDSYGRNTSTGIYFYKMITNEFQVSKKMLMMK